MTRQAHVPHGNYPSKAKEKRIEKEKKVPTGTIPEIMSWVGEDKDRAKQVKDEEAKTDKPRKTLMDRLEEVIND